MTARCAECGKKVEVNESTRRLGGIHGKPNLFCSTKCRDKWVGEHKKHIEERIKRLCRLRHISKEDTEFIVERVRETLASEPEFDSAITFSLDDEIFIDVIFDKGYFKRFIDTRNGFNNLSDEEFEEAFIKNKKTRHVI